MIDLAPLLNGVVIPLAVPVVSGAASWALLKVAQHFHIQIQDSQRAALNDAIYHAINWGARSMTPDSVKIRSGEVTEAAYNYTVSHVPGIMRSLGVTPESLRSMIQARVATRASSPLNVPPY